MNAGDRRNEVGFVPVPVPGHVNDHYVDAERLSVSPVSWRSRFRSPLRTLG
jgi:hypothetical protein